jgi:ATP-binding cassette, subfamily A (ABC1), member 3
VNVCLFVLTRVCTGDTQVTSGSITLQSSGSTHSNKFSKSGIANSIGYCPQYDPLMERMTVTETVILFASIKGVGNGNRAVLLKKVDDTLQQLGLHEHTHALAGKHTCTYSTIHIV